MNSNMKTGSDVIAIVVAPSVDVESRHLQNNRPFDLGYYSITISYHTFVLINIYNFMLIKVFHSLCPIIKFNIPDKMLEPTGLIGLSSRHCYSTRFSDVIHMVL